MKPFPPLATTGIGSVPFLNVDEAIDRIGRTCPEIPFWPQLVHRHPREDMLVQSLDGLPLLEFDEARRRISVAEGPREDALTAFYEHVLVQDWNHFAVPHESAHGLRALFTRAESDPSFGPDFIKAQVAGPVTFGQAVRTADGKTLLDDPEFCDVVVKGLGAKAAWLAQQIRDLGRSPLIFFDEPSLTGFGSAFSTLSREDVIRFLNEAADIVRSGGEARVGAHVCGNTDWSMMMATNLDVINFDAFGYLDHFLLYPDDIRRFLDRGGYLAWGIVPTLKYSGRETAEVLADRLKAGWAALAARGIDPDRIVARSLLTPSCGMGMLTDQASTAVLELLDQVQALLRA